MNQLLQDVAMQVSLDTCGYSFGKNFVLELIYNYKIVLSLSFEVLWGSLDVRSAKF